MSESQESTMKSAQSEVKYLKSVIEKSEQERQVLKDILLEITRILGGVNDE